MKNYLIIVDDDSPSYFDARNPSITVLTMNLTCDENQAKFIVKILKAKYTHPMIVKVYETATLSNEIQF